MRAAIGAVVPFSKSKHRYRLTFPDGLVDLWPTPRWLSTHFTLSSLYVNSAARGRGVGATYLGAVTAAADTLGYTLHLRPHPYGTAAKPDVAVLERWYRAFGFEYRRGGRHMIRRPNVRRLAA